jgi:hypothetical protein
MSDARCPRCGAVLPRHYPPCRETKLAVWTPVLWTFFVVPVLLFFVSVHASPVAFVLAIVSALGVTYLGARVW